MVSPFDLGLAGVFGFVLLDVFVKVLCSRFAEPARAAMAASAKVLIIVSVCYLSNDFSNCGYLQI